MKYLRIVTILLSLRPFFAIGFTQEDSTQSALELNFVCFDDLEEGAVVNNRWLYRRFFWILKNEEKSLILFMPCQPTKYENQLLARRPIRNFYAYFASDITQFTGFILQMERKNSGLFVKGTIGWATQTVPVEEEIHFPMNALSIINIEYSPPKELPAVVVPPVADQPDVDSSKRNDNKGAP